MENRSSEEMSECLNQACNSPASSSKLRMKMNRVNFRLASSRMEPQFIPRRHREFFPSQLNTLNLWDEVMREMECQCVECPFHSATGRLDFHHNLYEDCACHCCPCYARGNGEFKGG